MADPKRFAGKRALVTGASRGIGAAIAEQLAANGADVAITARTLEHHPTLAGSLQDVSERMGVHGNTVVSVVANLADGVDREQIVPTAVAGLGGPIDILVNNAAAAIYLPLQEFSLARRRMIFEVNTHAPIDLAQAVIPSMVERGEGWILNITSASAGLWDGPPFPTGFLGTTLGVYGSSKAALNRLSNILGAELHGTGVRVNTVTPRAAVLSEGADEIVGSQLSPEQIESMEDMVTAALMLCDCPPEMTGGTHVSLDLLGK